MDFFLHGRAIEISWCEIQGTECKNFAKKDLCDTLDRDKRALHVNTNAENWRVAGNGVKSVTSCIMMTVMRRRDSTRLDAPKNKT